MATATRARGEQQTQLTEAEIETILACTGGVVDVAANQMIVSEQTLHTSIVGALAAVRRLIPRHLLVKASWYPVAGRAIFAGCVECGVLTEGDAIACHWPNDAMLGIAAAGRFRVPFAVCGGCASKAKNRAALLANAVRTVEARLAGILE